MTKEQILKKATIEETEKGAIMLRQDGYAIGYNRKDLDKAITVLRDYFNDKG